MTSTPSQPRIAVTGSSGFLGAALVPALGAAGWQVIRVTRTAGTGAGTAQWDPARGLLDPAALAGVDAVIHLAGAPIDTRWTPEYKRTIRTSRVDSTALLARTLASLRPRPSVLLSASAVGIYGDRGDTELDEASTLGDGYLADVGRAWEAAAAPARDAGIRVVHPRLGLALARGGGALAKMLPPFELGAGGKIGRGTQWMSWIARDDLVEALEFILRTPALSGPVNVTSPNPVTNAEFARTLGQVLHRPAVATIPPFVVRLLYGELADAGLLTSQRAVPRRLLAAGFVFGHPTLESALRHELLSSHASRLV